MAIAKTKSFIKQFPSHTVFFSIITLITLGTSILALPICHIGKMSLIDLFFTVTSMTTVTGMIPVSWYDFTTTGHIVLLILMQIGGLGLMMISLLIVTLLFDIGLYTQTLTQEILSIQSFYDTKKIISFILWFTLVCELLGAGLIFIVLRHDYPAQQALFLSIFHAISFFCNVGATLFKNDNLAYNTNLIMILTSTFLILAGSLGFVIWHDLKTYLQKWYQGHKHILSWQTTLMLQVFFIGAAITAVLFWLLERNQTLHQFTALQTLCNLLLISVSTKSAGYLPVTITLLKPATILLLAGTAFIGSAPSSTGGGIKTSAFAIFLAVIKSFMRHQSNVYIHGKQISKDQIYRAMTIITLSCAWIIGAIFCLLITETHQPFMSIMYEVVSAFSNNGSSLGLTERLTTLGKIWIIATMIVGRVGAFTLLVGMQRSSDLENLKITQ